MMPTVIASAASVLAGLAAGWALGYLRYGRPALDQLDRDLEQQDPRGGEPLGETLREFAELATAGESGLQAARETIANVSRPYGLYQHIPGILAFPRAPVPELPGYGDADRPGGE